MLNTIDWKGRVSMDEIRQMLAVSPGTPSYRYKNEECVAVEGVLTALDKVANWLPGDKKSPEIFLVKLVGADEQLWPITTQTYRINLDELDTLTKSVVKGNMRRNLTPQELGMINGSTSFFGFY